MLPNEIILSTAARCAFLLQVVLVAAALACGGTDRPNVVLITLDTTRADALGSYGSAPDSTPRIDAFARDATLFENTQSSSAATPTSHASILTGLYPYHHGVRVISAASGFRLDEKFPTLTTLLKSKGYATAAVHSSFTVSSTFGFGFGFDHFDDLNTRMAPVGDAGYVDWDLETYQRRADETSQRAIALTGHLPEPFFLWIHYWDPHDEAKLPPPEFLRDGAGRRGGAPLRHASDELYAEEVRYMDQQLGLVFDALAERKIWDDTITVITADHGQGLSDGIAQHGWRGHRMLYHEQLDVPLILRIPGRGAGHRVAGVTRTVDILPTLLDFLGIESPVGLDGASLRPLVEGRSDPVAPRVAYAEQLNGYDWNARLLRRLPKADFLYSVRDERWKLIYRPSRPELSELFDLLADPKETRNLFVQHPEEVERLLGDLARRRPWVDQPFPSSGGALSEDERDALVALGYGEDPGDRTGAGPRWGWRCPQGGPIASEPGSCGDGDTPMVLVARTEPHR